MYINVHFHTKMCKNVIQVYENVIQVYIFAHKNKGVQKGGKCSAMYFNLYSTFPSAICYPFHFTWFLLLLSVPRCHSLEHFAMDLATFQHILEERGLQSIAVRAQQHHADKWLSLLCTEDKQAEFKQMIDLAIKVPTMRDVFCCDDVMMSAMLEAESKDEELKTKLKIVGKGQDEAVADSKKKSRPKSDFNLGQAGIPITGAFWTQNLDKVFFYAARGVHGR